MIIDYSVFLVFLSTLHTYFKTHKLCNVFILVCQALIFIDYLFFVFYRGIVPITCDELFKIIERGDGSIVS